MLKEQILVQNTGKPFIGLVLRLISRPSATLVAFAPQLDACMDGSTAVDLPSQCVSTWCMINRANRADRCVDVFLPE